MWREIEKHLPEFPSAVITGVDPVGFPVSARCRPQVDAAERVLRVQLPPGADFQPGPAGLLCHTHDERLWNLKSFLVRGVLERDAQGWRLRPRQFIPGMGIGGLMSYARFVRQGRRNAQRYLEQRGWPRPRVPWGELKAFVDELKSGNPKSEV
jgi:hypothetical protein